MQKERMSLQALCEEIAPNKNLSARTLRRRFEKLLHCTHGNVAHLKNEKGKIIFEGEQVKYTKTLLIALADDKSAVVSFLDTSGTRTFGEVNRFIQKLLEAVTEGLTDEAEIQGLVNYVCMIFMVPWHNSISRCYRALDQVFHMYRDFPYTHQSILSENLEDFILRTCTSQMVMGVDMLTELAENMLRAQDISDSNVNYLWYGDDEIAWEYAERDRRVYAHLRDDKELRKYIEGKINKDIDEIFPIPAKHYKK